MACSSGGGVGEWGERLMVDVRDFTSKSKLWTCLFLFATVAQLLRNTAIATSHSSTTSTPHEPALP